MPWPSSTVNSTRPPSPGYAMTRTATPATPTARKSGAARMGHMAKRDTGRRDRQRVSVGCEPAVSSTVNCTLAWITVIQAAAPRSGALPTV